MEDLKARLKVEQAKLSENAANRELIRLAAVEIADRICSLTDQIANSSEVTYSIGDKMVGDGSNHEYTLVKLKNSEVCLVNLTHSAQVELSRHCSDNGFITQAEYEAILNNRLVIRTWDACKQEKC